MTDKTLEAVARAIGSTTDFDGDRMASRYADSELRDMAQAAITAARPLIMGEERAAVVAWLRGHAAKRLASSKRVTVGGEAHWYHLSMSAELTGYADAIERTEHLRGGE